MDPRSEVLLRQAELFGVRCCWPACPPMICSGACPTRSAGAGTLAIKPHWTHVSKAAAISA